MLYIRRSEQYQAQSALLVAIALQALVWKISHQLFSSPHYVIIFIELALAVVIGLSSSIRGLHTKRIHHEAATILIGLMSAANIAGLIIVVDALIRGTTEIKGMELLAAAIAIFLTNIIVYALWYWEIDSPGLTHRRWSKYDKDFQFSQQDLPKDFPNWKPEFFDYLYLSVTNAINFAPADTRPLTRNAKVLMGSQAMISVFTLALLIARSVSILGN